MTLVWRPGYGGAAVSDPDAQAYLQAVEVADNEALEQGVQQAVNQFVIGCKADGIWNAIKASCILAGARTRLGALTPLVGTAPTPFNFIDANYDRKTGLVGDGTSKYLNSNRNNNADPQNNFHLAIWKSDSLTATNPYFIGGNTSGFAALSAIGEKGMYSNSTVVFGDGADISGAQGFHGDSRISSSNVSFKRPGGIVKTASNTSTTPPTTSHFVYGLNNAGTPGFYTASRLAFYSIGESLDLALLDTRVSTLIAQFGAVIP